MPDPRLQLTAQELVYAASALRAEARRAERQAADPQYESVRSIFEKAAEAYDALAKKLARIAEWCAKQRETSAGRNTERVQKARF